MRDKIISFFGLTGIDKFSDAMIDGLIEQMYGSMPIVSPPTLNRVTEVARSALVANRDQLVSRAVAVYAEVFTEKNIDDLITFYSSSTGRRIVELGGIMLPSLLEVGTAWGVDVLRTVEGQLSAILVDDSAESPPQPQPQP